MKFIIALCLFAAAFISASAQNEDDFAASFMKRFGESSSLTCSTVSPAMMEKLLQSEDIDLDEQKTLLLKNIRSIRIVQEKTRHKDATLYNAAAGMLERLPKAAPEGMKGRLTSVPGLIEYMVCWSSSIAEEPWKPKNA